MKEERERRGSGFFEVVIVSQELSGFLSFERRDKLVER